MAIVSVPVSRVIELPTVRVNVPVALLITIEAGLTVGVPQVKPVIGAGAGSLTEQVLPELKGKGARSIHVKALAHKPDLSKKYKFYMVPSRWLQELLMLFAPLV